MKVTLLFAMLTMVFALPNVSAKTELEILRVRCDAQEQKIRSLEEQIHQLRGSKAGTTADASPTAATDGFYVVKAGDSVERIAQRNRCSVSILNKVNGLKSTSIIHPGQRLKLPGMASTKAESPTASPSPNKTASEVASSGKTHKIKQGETYGSIAKKYQVSVDSLISANPSVKATALRPGQEIRISAAASPAPAVKSAPVIASKSETPSKPASKPSRQPAVKSQSSNASPRPRPLQDLTSTQPVSTSKPISATAGPALVNAAADSSPKPAAVPENSTPAPEKKIRSVKIEGPVTYGQFAAQHGTDSDRLNDLNGLDLSQATVLAKGSELYVPAQP